MIFEPFFTTKALGRGIALFAKYRNRLKQDISIDEKLMALADMIAVSVILNRSKMKKLLK